ncbi:TIGR02186 family protein [Sphingomonas canadensis]|uniref:TIGR02186 family protein n=1 Tax=Sphingomonas canadensis TaxID=1219257 RepID=A0ABW3H0D9_9SPHN|nr:TIGR02186 family protein [Sphingomonas canadensis]MCW3835149.1 TIGR02186 family protein [Sphingomonas canadensis]
MSRAAALLLAIAAPALLGQAEPAKPVLVPDVSQRDIEIVYSFTGADLLLFGAIVYPGGQAPEPGDKPADVVVVLKGPVQSVLVREKEKVAGIWVNADRMRYRSAPSFYAIASSRPIGELVDARTRAIYELGLDSLQLSPASGAAPAIQARFDSGLVDLRRRNGLYYESPGAVEITGRVLYRARLGIPARVPVGRYTAETFLIRDGRVLAAAVRPIEIRKSGFERFVANAAEHYSVPYGLAAVALSVLLGWAAGALWRRA